tara:strand:+ start:784 stop:1104 length:321 start_codon:yes stop_codon:yes gene_type:complete
VQIRFGYSPISLEYIRECRPDFVARPVRSALIQDSYNDETGQDLEDTDGCAFHSAESTVDVGEKDSRTEKKQKSEFVFVEPDGGVLEESLKGVDQKGGVQDTHPVE